MLDHDAKWLVTYTMWTSALMLAATLLLVSAVLTWLANYDAWCACYDAVSSHLGCKGMGGAKTKLCITFDL